MNLRAWVRVHQRVALRAVLSAKVGVGLAITFLGCATAGTAMNSATAGSFGRNDEVRVIGSFSDVRAVGVSRRYVFAATPSGISVYDRLFNAWLPPLSRSTGLVDMQITFMAGDPVEDAVWLGVPGAIIMFRPQGEVMQRTMLTGVPELIVFDRGTGGDAYVRMQGGLWNRVSRVGIATAVAGPPASDMRIIPRTLNDVYAAYPGLRNGAPLLFRNQQVDRPLRPYQVMSGSSAPDQPSEVWLGTNGDGLYRVDAPQQLATPLRFGLIERGVGAVALAADGVWAAGLGASQRGGLSFASNDLQHWRWIDGTINVPMNGMRATRLAVRAQRAWIATDRGLVRALLSGAEEMVAWTTLDGLPDDRVYAIAPRNDGAWIGTAQGVVYVSDSVDARNTRLRGISSRVLNNTPAYALQAVGDTLWIGSEQGLVAMTPGGTVLRPVGADPALRRRIVALAWSDSVLLAASEDAVLQLAPKGGREPSRVMALDVTQVGQVTRLAIDDRTMVMTGTNGVVVAQRGGGVHTLRVPNDIPGPVLDIAMSRDWIWLATPEGLVRLRRASDGGLP